MNKLTNELHHQDGNNKQRLFILVDSGKDRVFENVKSLLLSIPDSLKILFLSHDSPQCLLNFVTKFDNVDLLSPLQYKTLLGSEYDFVIYCDPNNFNANSFFASTGLVRHSGGYALFLPSTVHEGVKKTNLFNNLVSKTVTSINQPFCKTANSSNEISAILRNWYSNRFTSPEYKDAARPKLTSSQSSTLSSIEECLRQNVSGKIFIFGRRGRGKSTLLGEVAKMAMEHGLTCAFTSAHKRHCITAIERFEGQNKSKNFIPFDVLIESPKAIDLLLIDEFASLPLPVLESLLDKYPKVVASGTSIGYEGSGQGLIIRLFPTLEDIHYFHLFESMRFPQDDVIENIEHRLLPLDSTSELNMEVCPSYSEHDLNIIHLNKHKLVKDFSLYQRVFSLLLDAHYQTTPSDIQRILDDDSFSIHIAQVNNKVIGVCVCIYEELNCCSELKREISRGNRRLQGNLFLQNICQHFIEPSVLEHKAIRIQRIAIESDFRRRGIASQMIDEIGNQATNKGAILCTSFGATEPLLKFWRATNFTLIKLGEKVDNASNTISAFCIQTDDNALLEKLHYHEKLFFDICFWGETNRFEYNPKIKNLLSYVYSTIPELHENSLLNIAKSRLTYFTQDQVRFNAVKAELLFYASQVSEIKRLYDRRLEKGTHKKEKLSLEELIKKSLTSAFEEN